MDDVRIARTERKHVYPKPLIRWVEPHGLGTSQLQCVTDYLAELADRHWMTTMNFWNNAALRTVLKYTGGLSKSRFEFSTSNGYGPRALFVMKSLQQIGLPKEFQPLSYLPLGCVFDCRGHGLISDELRWCPQCWRHDLSGGQRPYVRLLWITMPVKVCPLHRRILENRCVKCGSKQFVVGRIPRAWVCDACGYDIFDRRVNRDSPKQYNGDELWKATANGRLIERTCSGELSVEPDAVAYGVKRLLDVYYSGSAYRMGLALNVEHMSIHSWERGVAKPALDTFLDFCCRLNILPDELLSGQNTLTVPMQVCLKEKAFVRPRSVFDRKSLSSIRECLDKLIERNLKCALPVNEIARNLHMTYTSLGYHFPRQYKILRQRYLDWVLQVSLMDAERREKRLREGVHWLRQRYTYPSERHLKNLTGVLPSDLRRSEIVAILRQLQHDKPGLISGARNRRKKSC